MTARQLAKKIFEEFETRDVYQIAGKSNLKIIYEKWFPVTAGEFYWQTKTICVNENSPVGSEQIIAHELGHFFVRKFELKKISDEEEFCDDFANSLLKNG
jgi:Zn-dependent peptidase ImmA (M78 family)